MSVSQLFADPYLLRVVLRALAVGALVSLCAAMLGVTLVLRRFSMIGDGLSHVGFGAMALGTLLGLTGSYAMEFTLPAVALAAFLLLRLGDSGRLKGEAAVAVLSSAAMALGVLFYSLSGGMTADACNTLFGSASVLTLSNQDAWLSLGLSVAVLLLFACFYHRIFAVTFDPAYARATGLAGGAHQLLLALLTAVTVVVGMKMMGAVMISALILFPALIAMRLCASFRATVLAAAVAAEGCFLVGFALAVAAGLPTGPTVVTVELLVFLAASVKRRA